jgi:hypothetical protein
MEVKRLDRVRNAIRTRHYSRRTEKRALIDHLQRVMAQHKGAPGGRRGALALPGALRLKYPNAPREWTWQRVFPATRFHVDQETGERRRDHLHESVLQRAVKDAARAAGITRPATWDSLRHPGPSVRLIREGVDGNELSAVDARRRARYTAAVGSGLGLGRTVDYLLAGQRRRALDHS